MPHGFPAFPQGRFPNDLPPTLFHPASPKIRPAKPAKEVKDIDAASMASTSTFSSTISLLKDSVKSKLPATSYKEHKARKERKEAAARSRISSTSEKTSEKRQLPPDTMTPRQRTTEAYMVQAIIK